MEKIARTDDIVHEAIIEPK